MVSYGQRIAVAAVAELELAFEVGAPQIIRCYALRQRSTGCPVTRSTDTLDQAMSMQNRVDRALGRDTQVLVQPP